MQSWAKSSNFSSSRGEGRSKLNHWNARIVWKTQPISISHWFFVYNDSKLNFIWVCWRLINYFVPYFVFHSSSETGLQLSQALMQQFVAMNNIARLMLDRGLVDDLVRIPHCLDISSPLMILGVKQMPPQCRFRPVSRRFFNVLLTRISE
jgi:hypothetical protein